MTFLIDKDEATAARRRVPFKLFVSNGTDPDTGASGDSVMYSVNGGAQSDLTASVISANAGMYYAEFAQADIATLGTIAMWHDVGSFIQHVANINVVNFNPMSDQSNIPLVATVTDVTNDVNLTAVGRNLIAVDSADSVWDRPRSGHTAAGSFGQASQVLRNGTAQGGASSSISLDFAASTSDDFYNGQIIEIGSGPGANQARYITDYVGVSRLATVDFDWTVNPDATSEWVIRPLGKDKSDYTLAPGTHSDVTIQGILNDSVMTIAGVVNSATLINALNDIDGSEVTIHTGGITTASFAVAAIDAAALATDAVLEIADGVLDRDMGAGTDSGSSAFRTARDAFRSLRNRVESDTTQIYVYEEDDTTIKWTASINTTPSTDPHITGADPNS